MRIDTYKLIFWDFDGVIKESIDVKTKAFVHLFDGYSLKIRDKVRNHHLANGGMSRFEKIPLYIRWVEQAGNEEMINDYCIRFSKLVFDGVINSDWVPGSENYLKSNSHNQNFVIVSATPQKELELILEKLNLTDCFDNVFGSPKSKKDAISEILKSANVSPHKTLMIGDSQADMDAAHDNNVPFLLRVHLDNSSIFSTYKGKKIKDFCEYE